MTNTDLYAIDGDQLRKLRAVARRLFTEERMNGDEMRDLAQALTAVADVCEQIQIPTGG